MKIKKLNNILTKILFSIFIIIFLYIPNIYATNEIISSQMDTLNISSFIEEGEKYTKENFPDLKIEELLNSAISGNIDNKTIFKSILSLLGKELLSSVTLLGSILVIIVVHSILKAISENLENESISQITYYIQYILIATLLMTNFTTIITMIKETIVNLVGFMNSLIPILIALVVTTGSVESANLLQPLILFSVIFIGNTITLVILPMTLLSTVLGIVSHISEKIQIGKMANFLKSNIVWFLGFVIVIFIGITSLEGTITSNVDGLAAKGIKAAASSLIPVVGKVLGDSVDAVLGCASLLKNALGIVGIFIIVGICILPIIKIAILTITYHFAAAICEPLADKRIVDLLEQMGGTFKILLAIIFFIAALLIIGLAMTVKISNSGMMYR